VIETLLMPPSWFQKKFEQDPLKHFYKIMHISLPRGGILRQEEYKWSKNIMPLTLHV
jgi:hypothetical protein